MGFQCLVELIPTKFECHRQNWWFGLHELILSSINKIIFELNFPYLSWMWKSSWTPQTKFHFPPLGWWQEEKRIEVSKSRQITSAWMESTTGKWENAPWTDPRNMLHEWKLLLARWNQCFCWYVYLSNPLCNWSRMVILLYSVSGSSPCNYHRSHKSFGGRGSPSQAHSTNQFCFFGFPPRERETKKKKKKHLQYLLHMSFITELWYSWVFE